MFQIFIEDENDYCFKIYYASDLLLWKKEIENG
jgi:hypothetical protein